MDYQFFGIGALHFLRRLLLGGCTGPCCYLCMEEQVGMAFSLVFLGSTTLAASK